MGISTMYAALLVRAREQGVEFGRVATIGRQSLTVPPPDLTRLAMRLGHSGVSAEQLSSGGYAEGFLTFVLGASHITSFDFSTYEGADIVHDFNQSLDPSYHMSFDTVIDGGSIEHIFDVRTVLTNYMSMVKVGGSIFIAAPANNLMGHGFYQFSPELFYRVFSEENGFEIKEVCLIETPFTAVEVSASQRCYITRDPLSVGRRVNLVNDKPVMIFVHARRLADKPLFRTVPMQSDFAARWAKHERGLRTSESTGRVKSRDAEGFSHAGWRRSAKYWLKQKRKYSFRNRRFFERLDP